MWTCPVCKTTEIKSFSCPKCQYCRSDNFEAFPTLAPLPKNVQPLSKKAARWSSIVGDDALACVRCGGVSFAVHSKQRCFSCIRCGERINADAVWEMDPPAVERTEKITPVSQMSIAAGLSFSVGVCRNGTVVTTDRALKTQWWSDVATWKNIVSVSAGDYHILGLREDGTVAAAGRSTSGQCGTESWRNIVAISAGTNHSAGLSSDGRVFITEYTQAQEAKKWRNVVAVSAGADYTLALFKDGTVKHCVSGSKKFHFSNKKTDFYNWNDIIAISAGDNHIVGVRRDGRVVATGWNGRGQCNVADWRDITAVATGLNHTVGLLKDGTVVATGSNTHGQCNVGLWTDIVAIAAGHSHTVGLRRDGTTVATGSNESGQCDTGCWEDLLSAQTAPMIPKADDLWNKAGNLL